MDISVIVVTYNQESTIGRTLDSILSQQTEAEYEIIVGDDCSADGTEAICRRYAEKYPDKIRYFRRSANMGVVGNYFDCIAQARGRYLADCAGDDYWVDPLKLQKQFEVLESNPDVTLVATRWLQLDVDTGKTSQAKNEAPAGEYAGKDLLLPIITGEIWIHLCTALFRRDVILKAIEQNRGFFDDPNFSCEDQQILLICANSGEIIILPDITLYYSIGHESISHKKEFKNKLSYSSKAFSQSLALQKKFLSSIDEEESKQLDEYNDRMKAYLVALRFRCAPGVLKKDSTVCNLKFKNISLKTRLYQIIMKNELLWKSTLALRNLFPG